MHLSALVERGEGGLVDEYRSLLRLFDIRGTGGCVKRGNSSRLGLMILMMALSLVGERRGCSFDWIRIGVEYFVMQ